MAEEQSTPEAPEQPSEQGTEKDAEKDPEQTQEGAEAVAKETPNAAEPQKDAPTDTGGEKHEEDNENLDDAFDFFEEDVPATPITESEHVSEEIEEEDFDEESPKKITPKLLKDIANELGLIHLCWPDILPETEDGKEYPTPYYENNAKEKLLLLYAENFRQQFHFMYPDRKPLLLAADNECGLQKMVCTTIRPTRLPYPELSNWEGCARFVADHLVYVPLHKPTRFPLKVTSSTFVLKIQQGNCFEFSTVLCSFLTGIGYDAYVVSGYATKELCLADQSRIMNPELIKYKPLDDTVPPPPSKKYEMKLTKEFDSRYLKNMQERAEREAAAKKSEKKVQHSVKHMFRDILSDLPTDDLFGVRVHSWVLIRSGTLGIEEAFFIDPPTGRSFSPDNPNFLGLESLWNNANYWINLQDCSEGCKNLKFDLKDPVCWTWLLLAEPWYMRSATDENVVEKFVEDEEEEGVEQDDPEKKELSKYLVEKHLDMPSSWVSRLDIPEDVYKRRYPGGEKEVVYRKSKVYYYAPYVRPEGLIMRIITYSDENYEEKHMVYDTYVNRNDLLTDIIEDFEKELVTEKYARGREEATKEHQYCMDHTEVEDKRKLLFYYEARSDSLSELIMDPLYLTLHYVDRLDFLYYRHAVFEPRPEDDKREDKRIVLSLVEKFYRNSEKNNEEDIAERTYIPPRQRIFLKFHYGESKVVASTREFIKPPPEKLGDKLTYDPQMTIGFNVDPTYPVPKSYQLFDALKEQLAAEEKSFFEVRALEDELSLFLKLRIAEFHAPKLSVSIYDTDKNEEGKEEMIEKEKKMKDQIEKEYESGVDYLAPYLARVGLSNKVLDLKEAILVRDMCLADHKTIYVTRANNMQEAFERTCNSLRVKHYWYEQQRDILTKEEEEEYFEQCNQLRFYLHTLEIRLKRHRDLVPQKYRALEAWLKNDPRLAQLYK